MKDITPQIEPIISSESLESQAYSIRSQDMAIVFEILRSKMYSNPIKAVVREISCNARDAHREVNTPNRPIEITLPTVFSKQLQIKDHGPGISPERMGEIFLNYGASTKRDTNKYVGFFGMGAKSCFSYSDSFSVVTIVDGKKRYYTAIIDESKQGRMDLLQVVDTDESNGTTIIVPVKEKDFKAFAATVIEETQYWDAEHNTGSRPIIHNLGAESSYKVMKQSDLAGPDWSFFTSRSRSADGWYSTDQFNIIIDGIRYDCEMSHLNIDRYNVTDNYIKLLNKNIDLYFPTGLIALASNRDSIHFDDRTKGVILDKLKSVYESFLDLIKVKVDSFEYLCEAELYYDKMLKSMGFMHADISWKDLFQLKGLTRTMVQGVHLASYAKRASRRRSSYEEKVTRSNKDGFCFRANQYIVIKDKPIFAQTKVVEDFFKTAKVGTDPVDSVCVLSFDSDDVKNSWLKTTGLEYAETYDSSLFTQIDRPARRPREKTEKEKFVSFVGRRYTRSNTFYSENFDHIIDSENIYVTTDNLITKEFYLSDAEPCKSDKFIYYCCSLLDKNIYAVNKKNEKNLGPKWKSLHSVLIDFFNTTGQFIDSELRAYINSELNHNRDLYHVSYILDGCENYAPENNNSPIVNFIALYNKINPNELRELCRVAESNERTFSTYINKDNKHWITKTDINDYLESAHKLKEYYPLLGRLHESTDVLEYITLVDNYNGLLNKQDQK